MIKPVKKSCKNCLKGIRLGFNNDILCREKGIVSSDYCCSSHRFFIFEDFRKVASYRCSDCEYFILFPNEFIPTYGVCDLFSVRKCDGSIRKACSKFVRRKEKMA
ncbi:MAG: hypothetical protein GX957_09600 [Clostridiaceae bacterium]|nr:hypothetical protein [Clostridiaceae bacterium]